MSGQAVTVVGGGGIPVTVVESGAPVLTAVESGGVAVTIVESGGAPFIVEGLASDPLEDMLVALEGDGKLVSAWYLPLSEPDRHLTLNGAAVEGWAAAYGAHKLTLTELTNPPAWDATLFSNKGGVTFNGTSHILSSAEAGVASWPSATDDLYLLTAVRDDSGADGAIRYAFGYGSSVNSGRIVGKGSTNVAQGRVTGVNLTGTSPSSGAHTIGALVDIGADSAVYFDGASEGTASTALASMTVTRARMGANPGATAGQFWSGAIVAAAVLNATATLTDFTDLEALMRARVA